MRAYIYSTKRPKWQWPKVHWFFDDNPKAQRIMAACGVMANRKNLDSPTASYFINGKAIREGWCQKCKRWMDRNREALLIHERLTEGT